MVKKIIFISFLVLAASGAVFAYLFLSKTKKPEKNVIQLIPSSQCSLVLQLQNPLEFFKEMNENNLIYQEVLNYKEVNHFFEPLFVLDSLLQMEDEKSEFLNECKMLYVRYQDDEKNELIAFTLPNVNYSTQLENLLKDCSSSFEAPTNKSIRKVNFKGFKESFFFLHLDGNVFLSSSHRMLEKVISTDESSSLSNLKVFSSDQKASGSAQVFLPNQAFTRKFKDETFQFDMLFNSAWSLVDLNMKPNELRASTFLEDSTSTLLRDLKEQSNVEFNFHEQLPSGCSYLFALGISNVASFINEKQSGKTFSHFNAKCDAGLESELNNTMDDEMVFAKYQNEHYLYLETKDKASALKFVKQISDTSIYKSWNADSIYLLQNNQFATVISNGHFSLDLNYVCVYERFLLFAKSDSALHTFKLLYESKETLAENERFLKLKESNLSLSSNFLFYSEIGRNNKAILQLMPEKAITFANGNDSLLDQFSIGGFEFSVQKNKMQFQAYLQFNPQSKSEIHSLWESHLDTLAQPNLQTLINHKTGGKDLCVQDLANTFYLFSNTGKLYWKIKLDGPILGKIQQVDFYRNGKLQMLFNTPNTIHLIDRNGNYVPGYPYKTSSVISNPISVFDYENNKDYRILFACNDLKVRNINLLRQEVEGFNFPTLKDTVEIPIQFTRLNGKDYLIAFDKSGKLYGTGRKGEIRLDINERIANDTRIFSLESGKDINKTFITWFNSQKQSIERISLSGKKESHVIETQIKTSGINFSYLNEDKIIDVIISDETGFEAFDKDGIKLMAYLSKQELKPELTSILVDNQNYFMMLNKEEQLVIIDISGKEKKSAEYQFSYLPFVSQINNDGMNYLIGLKSNKIICFPWKN